MMDTVILGICFLLARSFPQYGTANHGIVEKMGDVMAGYPIDRGGYKC